MKILVIRFSSIGDIVLTTELLRCLRKDIPQAYIAYATKARFASLLADNPHVDEVISLADNFNAFKQEVKSHSFDVVLDLHHNLRSRRLTAGLGAKIYRFNKANFRKWQMVHLAGYKNFRLPHITQRYLDTAASLKVKSDGKGLDFHLPKPCTSLIPAQLSGKKYICLAIGGQHETKKLPVAKLIELVSLLKFPCILLGGKEDEPAASLIIAAALSQNVISMCGKTSIAESACIIKNSIGMITHDTGMMHIGAALDIPMASIWGNTVPGFGMWAYYPQNSQAAKQSAQFEVTKLSCRPCSKIGYKACPKGHFSCMEQQNMAEVANWANAL